MQSSDELWNQEIMDSIPDLIFYDYSAAPPRFPTQLEGSCKLQGRKGGCMRRRRRCRASNSKKAPTTLLKADTKNFRALVQQFTGRHTSASSPLLGAYKGPINLNFKQCTYYPAQKQQQQMQMQMQHVGYSHSWVHHQAEYPFGANVSGSVEDSRGGQNPRADHDAVVDRFWGELLDASSLGSGDYDAVLDGSGAVNHHHFWAGPGLDIIN